MTEDRRALRVLVVDDEPLARARVEDLLREEPGVVVAGSAEDGEEAVEAIRALRPDLVFLDIQMPGKTGLEVVSAVGAEDMPATIFVTAYDEHALEAFEVAAVDYLVKPFDDERFARALLRARERLRLRDVEKTTRALLSALRAGPGGPEAAAPAAARRDGKAAPAPAGRILVESRGEVRFVPVADIDFVTASGPYAELHVGDKTHLIRERMQALERKLDPARFFRIHRSAIVRLDRVASLRRRGNAVAVVLHGGQELPVARSRRPALEKRLAEAPRRG